MPNPNPAAAFVERILSRSRAIGSWLTVGLDPDVGRFPDAFLESSLVRQGGLSELVFQFNQAVVSGAEAKAVAFKPQVAFYEQYGLEGMQALQKTLELLRRRGLPIILDGKRNDIGSTAAAYARAWLAPERRLSPSQTRPNDWRVDALTVSPYLGWDGIRPFAELARKHGSGLFILLRTSNPSGAQLQCLSVSPRQHPVWRELATLLESEIEATRGPAGGLSPVGFVVGATLPAEEIAAIRQALPHSLFLMPGIGAQGGDVRGLRAARAKPDAAILPSASRSILYPGGGRGAWESGFGDQESWLQEVRTHAAEETAKLARELHPILFD